MHPALYLELAMRAVESAGGALPAACQTFSKEAAELTLTALWQSAAIAAALAISLRLAPRSAAAHRFTVWAAGFGALVALQAFPLVSHFLPVHVPAAAAGLATASTASKPLFQIDLRWSLLISLLWIAASLFRAVDLALHSARLRSLWSAATPVQLEGSLTSLARSVAIRGRKQVEICTTHDLERPSVIGFSSPRILIPDWLFGRLTPGELEQIVLHEAEHLRRRDDWSNLLQKLCLVLFPLNPALAWIERRLCREREMACDDGVVRITNAPRAYAACLTSLAERRLQRRTEALSLGAWQRRPELARRVHSILRRRRALSPMATNALLGALGCGLVFGSVELARCPQLVAFVPAHREVAQRPVSAKQSAALAHLQSVSSNLAPPPVAANDGPIYRAMNMKMSSGMLRAERGPRPKSVPVSFRPKMHKAVTETAELASAAPHEELLKARATAAQSDVVQEQSWIQFTAWEQVPTAKDAPGKVAENSSRRGTEVYEVYTVQTMSNPQRQGVGRRANRIRVTRLFLKVYPANSTSARLAIAAFRDGLLVIPL